MSRVPFPYVADLPKRAQWELERNFFALSMDEGSNLPFVVVAGDGSGDYTSIKSAVDAIADSAPTMVYVKGDAAATLSDSSSTIDIGGKNVWILAAHGGPTSSSGENITWTFGGFTCTGANGSVRVEGLNIIFNGTLLRATTQVARASFIDCYDVIGSGATVFGNATNTAWSTIWSGVRSVSGGGGGVGTLFGASLTWGGNHRFYNCTVSLGSAVTISGSYTVLFEGCFLTWTSFTFSNTGTSRPTVHIDGCTRSVTSSNVTFNNCESLNITGFNDSFLNTDSTWTMTVNYALFGFVNIQGNFSQCTLTVASTTTSVGGPYISGKFARVVLNAQKCKLDAVIAIVAGNNNQTALTLSADADNCMCAVALENGSGTNNTGISVASGATNNVIIHSGVADFTTGVSDSGTGTSINSFPPSGAAGGDLSGTYPNPSVVDDSHNHTGATITDVDADEVNIVDAGGYYTGTETEAALQEIGAGDMKARFMIGSWYQTNVSGTQTDIELERFGVTGVTPLYSIAVRAGSITGISVGSTEARTAGTLTVEVTKNGAGTGLTAVLDGTNTQYKATTQAAGGDTFVAGDRLGVRVTTVGWTPTSADIGVEIEVVA